MRHWARDVAAVLAVSLVLTTSAFGAAVRRRLRAAAGVLVGLAIAACAPLPTVTSTAAAARFDLRCTVLAAAPVAAPPLFPSGPAREDFVVFYVCGRKVLHSAVSPAFFLSAERGECLRVRGELAGGELRDVTLTLPCTVDPRSPPAVPGGRA